MQWYVQTQGVLAEFSEPSVLREINVYARPTVELDITDDENRTLSVIEQFPFYIKATAGPINQTPIGYHVNIISNELYDTFDTIGNPKTVNVNESLYSKFFDTSQRLIFKLELVTPLYVLFLWIQVSLANRQ